MMSYILIESSTWPVSEFQKIKNQIDQAVASTEDCHVAFDHVAEALAPDHSFGGTMPRPVSLVNFDPNNRGLTVPLDYLSPYLAAGDLAEELRVCYSEIKNARDQGFKVGHGFRLARRTIWLPLTWRVDDSGASELLVNSYNKRSVRERAENVDVRQQELSCLAESMASALGDAGGAFQVQGEYVVFEGAEGTRFQDIDASMGLSSEPHQNTFRVRADASELSKVFDGLEEFFVKTGCSAHLESAMTQELEAYERWRSARTHRIAYYHCIYEGHLCPKVRAFARSGEGDAPEGFVPYKNIKTPSEAFPVGAVLVSFDFSREGCRFVISGDDIAGAPTADRFIGLANLESYLGKDSLRLG